jgi:hypothetical protein
MILRRGLHRTEGSRVTAHIIDRTDRVKHTAKQAVDELFSLMHLASID